MRLSRIIAEIKPYWLQKLSSSGAWFGIEEIADMMEETGWFESEFQAAFHELEKEGKAKNIGQETHQIYSFHREWWQGRTAFRDKK